MPFYEGKFGTKFDTKFATKFGTKFDTKFSYKESTNRQNRRVRWEEEKSNPHSQEMNFQSKSPSVIIYRSLARLSWETSPTDMKTVLLTLQDEETAVAYLKDMRVSFDPSDPFQALEDEPVRAFDYLYRFGFQKEANGRLDDLCSCLSKMLYLVSKFHARLVVMLRKQSRVCLHEQLESFTRKHMQQVSPRVDFVELDGPSSPEACSKLSEENERLTAVLQKIQQENQYLRGENQQLQLTCASLGTQVGQVTKVYQQLHQEYQELQSRTSTSIPMNGTLSPEEQSSIEKLKQENQRQAKALQEEKLLTGSLKQKVGVLESEILSLKVVQKRLENAPLRDITKEPAYLELLVQRDDTVDLNHRLLKELDALNSKLEMQTAQLQVPVKHEKPLWSIPSIFSGKQNQESVVINLVSSDEEEEGSRSSSTEEKNELEESEEEDKEQETRSAEPVTRNTGRKQGNLQRCAAQNKGNKKRCAKKAQKDSLYCATHNSPGN